MRHVLAALLLVALVPLRTASAQAPAPLEFPPTAAGRHAEAWFAAYHDGEEALRAFWNAHASAASLAQRPVEARLEFMRRVRSDQGGLTPVRLVESDAAFCELIARAEHGGQVRIRFQCSADDAKTLESIRIEPVGDAANGAAGGAGMHGAGEPVPDVIPDTGPPPTDAQIVASLASRIDSLTRVREFSGAAMLEMGNDVQFVNATGMAVWSARRRNTSETRFNLGSLNKIFTHVAIEQLAQAGKLRLDDSLGRWLPDYKVPGGSAITLRQLLDHRAGVPDMLTNPVFERDPGRVRTMADWYALVRDMPLEFAPGTQQRYSNGGFVLLGMVVAAAAHEDYHEYVREHVYVPAGMTHSGHVARDEASDDVAIGYTRGTAKDAQAGNDLVPNTPALPGRGSSAGGGYSTVGDLVKFADALRTHRLLDDAHVRDVFGDHFALAIAGGSPGVNGVFMVAGPYTLVVLANLDPPSAEALAMPIGRMVRRAAGIAAPARR